MNEDQTVPSKKKGLRRLIIIIIVGIVLIAGFIFIAMYYMDEKDFSKGNNTITTPMPTSYSECINGEGFDGWYNDLYGLKCTWFAETDQDIDECLNAGGGDITIDEPNCHFYFYNPDFIFPTTYSECIVHNKTNDYLDGCYISIDYTFAYNKSEAMQLCDEAENLFVNSTDESISFNYENESCYLIIDKPS